MRQMGTIRKYFKLHSWQARSLALMIMLMLGCVVGLLFFRPVEGRYVVWRMGSSDSATRLKMIEWAVALAKTYPAIADLLDDALSSGDDDKFYAAAQVLNRLGKFGTPGRSDLQADRLRWLDMSAARNTASSPQSRYAILCETIVSGRDNRYIRDILGLSAGDENQDIRAAGAVLAARLNDEKTIRGLLVDESPKVSAAAATNAAFAGMTPVAPLLKEILNKSEVAEPVSSAGLALAMLDPESGAQDICRRLLRSQQALRAGQPMVGPARQFLLESFELLSAAAPGRPGLFMPADLMDRQADLLVLGDARVMRDRLLYVVASLKDSQARSTVLELLADCRKQGEYPPAMLLYAAGRLGVSEAQDDIRAVLVEACKKRGVLREPQLLAAMDAAERLGLSVRAEAYNIVSELWHPNLSLSVSRAARLLGVQAAAEQPGRPDAPTRDQCVELLRKVATFYKVLPRKSARGGEEQVNVEIPSVWADAAVALWMLAPAAEYYTEPYTRQDFDNWKIPSFDDKSSALYVYLACRGETTLPGDCIAWHLGRSGRPEAIGLADRLLPPGDAPAFQREPSKMARMAGAMLMAIAAKTDRQKQEAVRRIADYENRARHVRDTEGLGPIEHRAMTCALLILGQTDRLQVVRDLMRLIDFPQRRTITALLLAGDRYACDWLLWMGRYPYDDMVILLVDRGLNEVFAAACPQLPPIEGAVEPHVRLWQAQIMQTCYGVRREGIKIGPGR
ncbi:MAG: hypothetical protein HZA50_00340 [Planctomycetes bacterium]|nr:hypothetical protein [Planctomycetota bacterium]